MFTDLGIDLSAMIRSEKIMNRAIKSRIALRMAIIFFFLLGGVIGGVVFMRLRFHAFFIPVCLLLIALFYDYFRIYFLRVMMHK
jgi:hypothetical protein